MVKSCDIVFIIPKMLCTFCKNVINMVVYCLNLFLYYKLVLRILQGKVKCHEQKILKGKTT